MNDATNSIRIDQIEKNLDREIGNRETAVKYLSRIIEDIQRRYSEAMTMFSRIESAFKQHLEDDKQMSDGIKSLDSRIRIVERLVWIAVGGIIVIGAIIGILGTRILNLLNI